jgi:hypothetical protein
MAVRIQGCPHAAAIERHLACQRRIVDAGDRLQRIEHPALYRDARAVGACDVAGQTEDERDEAIRIEPRRLAEQRLQMDEEECARGKQANASATSPTTSACDMRPLFHLREARLPSANTSAGAICTACHNGARLERALATIAVLTAKSTTFTTV